MPYEGFGDDHFARHVDEVIELGGIDFDDRGFIATLNKKGTKVESSKSEAGARTYTAAARS